MTDLINVSDNHVAILLGIVSLLVPGTAFMALYFPELFIELDFLKIFMLSIVYGVAIATPLLFTLLFKFSSKSDGGSTVEKREDGVTFFIAANLVAGVLSVILSLIAWLINLEIKLYLVMLLFLLYIALPYMFIRLSKK